MADIDMAEARKRHEEGVKASFELKTGEDIITINVKGPSYLDIAKALKHTGKDQFLANFLAGVTDPDGWEDNEE